MKNMTLENMAAACGGKLCNIELLPEKKRKTEAACVVIDSRKIEPDGVFIATKGERADGHDFIPAVAEKGALGIVCEKEPKNSTIPYILVEDSFQALKRLAAFYREGLSLPVVGITGSVGKTSTKEMIAGVLSQGFFVLKTEGNFNNEIGLPLTVLQIREEHTAAVLEMGISDFEEMHRLSKIGRPDICVITNIGQCHLENLKSREGVLKAKTEMLDYMNPKGSIFVNGDDDMLCHVSGKEKGKLGAEHPFSYQDKKDAVVHFGLKPENEIYASEVRSKGLLGLHAVIHMGHSVFPVEISIPGEHMIYNALAAAAVGNALGLMPKQIKEGIAKVQAAGGRSHVISLPSYTLIDDCYNANPVSMKAALSLLSAALGRKVAILGDMFELGEKEKELHKEVGSYAVKSGAEVLICVGALSKEMYRAASEENKDGGCELYYFEDRDTMLRKLPEILKRGDNILIKASHGMAFQEVVKQLQEAEETKAKH